MITIFICFFYCLFWYVMGGYATTDILRLTRESSTFVLANECYCPCCGYKIPLWKQIPIATFLFSKGKCSSCSNRIPNISIILEIGIPFISILNGIISEFSLKSFLANIFIYELIKIIVIIRFGKRKKDFVKNYLISIIANMVLFGEYYLNVWLLGML